MNYVYLHLAVIGGIILTSYALWIFFLAVMNIQRAWERHLIHPVALKLAYPIIAIGFVLDVAVNWFLLTPLLLEFPQELTVTKRLSRHIHDAKGSYRQQIAFWICSNLLDTFDPSGIHCKDGYII